MSWLTQPRFSWIDFLLCLAMQALVLWIGLWLVWPHLTRPPAFPLHPIMEPVQGTEWRQART